MKKKKSKYLTFFLIPLTIVLIILTFLIISEIPKTTIIGLDVFSKRVGFTLGSEKGSEEAVSLLNSVIWSTSLSVENFSPFSFSINSLTKSNSNINFENPLMITPDPVNGRITFNSEPSNFSIQNVFANSGCRISANNNGEKLSFEIQNSIEQPWLEVSFPEIVKVSVQSCNVRDHAGRDLTHWFTDTLSVGLQSKNKSRIIFGTEDMLSFFINDCRRLPEGGIQFLSERSISDPDFTKPIYRAMYMKDQSTIDSIFVRRKFPLENVHLVSQSLGDIKMTAEPNVFNLYDFSLVKNHIRLRMGGKLNSLIIEEGPIRTELVPRYLTVLTKDPSMVLIITWLGWIVAIFIPLFSKLRSFKGGKT